jgi:hypothetical protein
MAPHLDGFQLYLCGLDVLALRRLDNKGNELTSGRTGKPTYFKPITVFLDPPGYVYQTYHARICRI